MKIEKKIIIPSLIALAIAAGSAAVYASQKHDQHKANELASIQDAKLSLDDAINVALQEMPGKVFEAELEADHSVAVWEIELLNSNNEVYEYEINANTGAILETEKEDKSKKAGLFQAETLSLDKASKVALADMPGKVIEAELEKDDDETVWEIELVNANNEIYEYEINANTGAILESERDDD